MSERYPLISLKDAGVALIDCVHATPKATDSFGYPYVGIPQINDGRLNLSDARIISHEDMEEWNKKCDIRSSDIIVCRRCNSGISAVVPDQFTGSLGQNLVLLRSDERTLSQHYLRWAVRGREWWGEVNKYINVGAVFDSLKCKEIPIFRIPVPDLDTQKAIAHILGTLDDKIELNQKMNQTLEEIAKAIFKSWFVDFDPVRAKSEGRPTGLPPEISDLFPDELVDSEIGVIPRGWQQESLYEFCSVEYGAPFKSKLFNEEGLGIPLVRIRDLPKGKSDVFTEEIHPKGRLIEAGDLVVGMDGEFRCYLWKGVDSWMNQRICKFVPQEGVPPAFIWFALERPLHFIERTEVATTVIHLGKGDIDDFWFMRSSNVLLDKFGKITNPILEKIILVNKESEVLSQLRDTLLPKLISGELRIPDAEKFLEEAGI